MTAALSLVPEDMTTGELVSMSSALLESITDERDRLRAENERLREALATIADSAALVGRAAAGGAQPSTIINGINYLSDLASDALRKP